MAGGIDVVDPIADGRAVAQSFPDPGRLRSHQGWIRHAEGLVSQP